MVTLEPCEVRADVFIRLTRSNRAKRDTLYAHIGNYFTWAYRGNIGDEEVYYSKSPGSYRAYNQIYQEAIADTKEKENLVYYFIDKILLLKIDYLDIHGEKHEKYYSYRKEITKQDYDHAFEESDRKGLFFSLGDVTYQKLKEALRDGSV